MEGNSKSSSSPTSSRSMSLGDADSCDGSTATLGCGCYILLAKRFLRRFEGCGSLLPTVDGFFKSVGWASSLLDYFTRVEGCLTGKRFVVLFAMLVAAAKFFCYCALALFYAAALSLAASEERALAIKLDLAAVD